MRAKRGDVFNFIHRWYFTHWEWCRGVIFKIWFANYFDMKDLGETSYIFGIKLLWDRRNKILGLSQVAYIDKILVKFAMHNSKKWLLPFRHEVLLSKEQCLKTFEDEQRMKAIPYTSAVGILIYFILCTRPDICYVVDMVNYLFPHCECFQA